MTRTNWNRVSARSLRHAIELCIAHAKEKKSLSVERIADLMGVASHWNIYKWLENGRMPATLILPFENACGANYLTRYLAVSEGQILIDMPRGKKASQEDLLTLQTGFNEALNLLAKFYKDEASAEQTIGALNSTMSEIASHRHNVNKVCAPELAL